MSITLEKSLKNRQVIIDNVKEEMIGPGQIRSYYKKFNPIGTTVFDSLEEINNQYYWEIGGTKEEIIQRGNPTDRYVSGHLFPMYTHEDDVASVTTEVNIKEELSEKGDQQVAELFNSDKGIEITEEDGEIELLPQKNEFMPSTMGLTYCVHKELPELEMKVTGGHYKSHTVHVRNPKKEFKWWLRESVEGKVKISVADLLRKKNDSFFIEMKNKRGELISHYNIQLQLRIREINGKYIITTSVTNRSETRKLNKQQCILFQAELAISTTKGFYFSVYPKFYEMKHLADEEEASSELLYRNEDVYAFGHGCSTHWKQNNNKINEIKTTFMPQYEALSMTPDVFVNEGGKKVKLKIKMSDLAGISSKKLPGEILQPLLDGYELWIKEKESEIDELPAPLRKIANKHIELCRFSLNRMETGLQLLSDAQVLEAFRMANLAILMQQENGKSKRFGVVENGKLVFDESIKTNLKDEQVLKNHDNTWRAFQIAFFLISIESFVNERSDSREIVDLIWFPTGGGKTEAYLGVAAFEMLLRRLKNPMDAGVDIIMRYTLRLLTADQFQRSSRLICALEYLRRKNEDKLGATPFSIGIWVGSNTTPNKNVSALQELSKLEKNKKDAKQFLVHNCPWCGAHLGYYEEKLTKTNKRKYYLGYKNRDNKLVVYCPDKECHFHEELPIYIVDEAIYEKRPTFLIGTVDKFVQLAWEPKARAIFGLDSNGNRMVNPPTLIIQDELHLISGPLGTLTGLFETLIEELCIKETNNKVVKPKIIAATATIKQYESQIQALFGRKDSYLFPSPGLESNDSFFATPEINEKTGKPMPGRKYVGINTSTVRIMMSQVMSFSAILQAVKEIDPSERDPYWTLLAFYNTIRELGGALTLAQTDIPQYSRSISQRKGTLKDIRYVNNVLELTSRKQSHEISKTIDELKEPYNPNAQKSWDNTIDLCLASNIIEVGVDIDRLSVMTIVGQPKMTAQYIQVSGRVGRRWWERPGLIFTLYSNTKSRDKSHFEHFREYHQKLYSQVEPTSVTPFSDSCLERGLHAIIVGFLRQALNAEIARTPNWKEINKYIESKFLPFYKRLINRAELVDPEQVNELKKRVDNIMTRLQNGHYTSWKVGQNVEGYMYPAGMNVPLLDKNRAQSMINSLRNVDAECRGQIVSTYQYEENKPFSMGDFLK